VKRVAISLLMFLIGPAQEARAAVPALGRVYALEEASDFEEGCFYLCDCPIVVRDGLQGRFTLVPLGSENGFDLYAVNDLEWMVAGDIQPAIEIHGSGTYRVGYSSDGKLVQELDLDLVVGDRDAEPYTSGLVPVTTAFPEIDIRISRNPYGCFDTQFLLSAAPSRSANRSPRLQFEQSDPPRGRIAHWGLLKSRFRQ
jgi:hypothetical protein